MVNRNEVEQRWKQRGFSCDLWIDPPGATWEGTIHGVDEVFMVVRGQMELEIGGEITHPEIGEEVSIPAGTRHTVRNLGESILEWLVGYAR